jgi:hypothetical protein
MMRISKRLLPLALLGLAPLTANAQVPGTHPGYLHALSDLRAARWFLNHKHGDSIVAGDEDFAITQIDAAINDVVAASIDTGKDLNYQPPVDTNEHGSRLLKAIETLKKAHADIDGEEDSTQARAVRKKAFGHIDAAIRAVESAHAKWVQAMQ